jgi:hypothetical protein
MKEHDGSHKRRRAPSLILFWHLGGACKPSPVNSGAERGARRE